VRLSHVFVQNIIPPKAFRGNQVLFIALPFKAIYLVRQRTIENAGAAQMN
jgi:hypothetical protein